MYIYIYMWYSMVFISPANCRLAIRAVGCPKMLVPTRAMVKPGLSSCDLCLQSGANVSLLLDISGNLFSEKKPAIIDYARIPEQIYNSISEIIKYMIHTPISSEKDQITIDYQTSTDKISIDYHGLP